MGTAGAVGADAAGADAVGAGVVRVGVIRVGMWAGAAAAGAAGPATRRAGAAKTAQAIRRIPPLCMGIIVTGAIADMRFLAIPVMKPWHPWRLARKAGNQPWAPGVGPASAVIGSAEAAGPSVPV
ncbi:hypothetical protein Psi01_77620 [Planobispora siamensis]|uniref:Uncharacterized protein n=1 Tax=Planobispora siamensis TaxID=936338 RepID=A0A8J3SMU9_9ACTN|nr:hypothetical protein Psi01_77620 [Planobispora siamensis]